MQELAKILTSSLVLIILLVMASCSEDAGEANREHGNGNDTNPAKMDIADLELNDLGIEENEEAVEAEEATEVGLHWEPLELTSYSAEVGAVLTSPEYQLFDTNSRFLISGTIEKYEQLHTPFVWIEVEANSSSRSEQLSGGRFTYWTPLEAGSFEQDVQLFAGEGEYTIHIRVPSIDDDDTYYDIAQLEVYNENKEISRDIEYTLVAYEAGLRLDERLAGYQEAEGTYSISGSLPADDGTEFVMIALDKDGDRWDTLVPVQNGHFQAEVPLYFGEGVHHLQVLLPGEEDHYYYEAALLIVNNTTPQDFIEIERYQGYLERGIELTYPLETSALSHEGLTHRIAGTIDPEASRADEITHVIVQTIKGEDEATYHIPVEDHQFDDEIWLRFGPGEYEITVNVPDNQNNDHLSFFQFAGVASFTREVTSIEDRRSLLPSRGIESDSPLIAGLAQELTEGITAERAKAKAIYEYVAQTIEYDVEKYEANTFDLNDSALKTLEEKKGVCQDYAFLAVALFRSIEMEANYIAGIATSGGASERHAWVEVKVDGEWLVMDPTWGAGYLQGGQFVFHYNETYFDPDPDQFARTHTREEVMY